MQNKIIKIAIAQIGTVKDTAKSLTPKELYFLFFHENSLFFGVHLKKVFFCSIFNAVFNIVKINFSSKFLHGIPYNNANFSPREFQANRSVTVKVLSLSALSY